MIRQQSPISCRRKVDRRAGHAPIETVIRPPHSADGDGGGRVLASTGKGWHAEPWRDVARQPKVWKYWVPIVNVLPDPEEE